MVKFHYVCGTISTDNHVITHLLHTTMENTNIVLTQDQLVFCPNPGLAWHQLWSLFSLTAYPTTIYETNTITIEFIQGIR